MELLSVLGLSLVSLIEWMLVLILAWPATSMLLLLVLYLIRRRRRTVLAHPAASSPSGSSTLGSSNFPVFEDGVSSQAAAAAAVGHRRNRSLGFVPTPGFAPPPAAARLSRCDSVTKIA